MYGHTFFKGMYSVAFLEKIKAPQFRSDIKWPLAPYFSLVPFDSFLTGLARNCVYSAFKPIYISSAKQTTGAKSLLVFLYILFPSRHITVPNTRVKIVCCDHKIVRLNSRHHLNDSSDGILISSTKILRAFVQKVIMMIPQTLKEDNCLTRSKNKELMELKNIK